MLYALDTYRPNIDGVGVSVERQALGLASRDHQVAIVAPGERFADYQEQVGEVQVFRLRSLPVGTGRWRMATMAGASVENILRSYQPNLVVVSLPFLLNRTVSGEAERLNIPRVGIVGTMPEWLLYNLGFLKPLAERLYSKIWDIIADFYNRCQYVVTPTQTALELVQRHGLERPAVVISNGVDLDQFSPRPRDVRLASRLGIPDRPAVLYTGRLDAEKCMDVWVKAIPHVLERVEAHFIIGGNGTEREKLASLVADLGVKDHVTFTGFLDEGDYHRVYSLASAFAIASPAELQSIVTLEAAASGLPIVAVNAGALPELVTEGRNGFLFPQDDSEEMGRAIVRVLRDSDLAHRLRTGSREVALQHDIRLSVEQYERLYRKLTQGEERAA